MSKPIEGKFVGWLFRTNPNTRYREDFIFEDKKEAIRFMEENLGTKPIKYFARFKKPDGKIVIQWEFCLGNIGDPAWRFECQHCENVHWTMDINALRIEFICKYCQSS